MKLETLQTPLLHLRRESLAVGGEQLRQHPRRSVAAPLRIEVAEQPRHGRHDVLELQPGDRGTTGCSVTALATTVRTSGTRPGARRTS